MNALHHEALLFDFDGVIGRTMEDNHRAWVAVFAPYGVEVVADEYFLMEGMNIGRVAETYLRRAGLDPALAAEIGKAKDAYYAGNNTFAFYPGVPEMIERAAQRAPLGLVSGGNADRLEATAGKAFLGQFKVVVTGDMVTNPKPDPEPYLRAARGLRLPPAACLVVENAPMGIASAKAAGMKCAALCTTLAEHHLADADFVLADHAALRALLEI